MDHKDKLLLTRMRIQQWYEYWNGNVYVAFSGGKDSTVLAHIVHKMYPDVPLVFNNTGLEFPEIKEFVKTFGDKVTWLKPKLSYQKVVAKYGFALVSKETSQKIHEIRHTKSDKLRDIRINGYPNTGYGKVANKWLFLKDAPFEISHRCCDALKKEPARRYERETGRKVMTGEMSGESNLRATTKTTLHSCNAYDRKRPKSTPLNKWSESDIDQYVKENNVPLSKIYDMGYERTGCAWCAFGLFHPSVLRAGKSKFKLMKRTHPKIYAYSLDKLGLREPIEYICKELGIDSSDVI